MKSIDEIAMNFINSKSFVDIEDMVEIVDTATIDMESGEAIEGGLFDEKAFGASWREICQDYHGESDWMPSIDESDIDEMGKGGYIRLATPINWALVRGKDEDTDPLCLDIIGVLHPSFRPMVKVDGKTISHPMNDIYRDIMTINQRIQAMLDTDAPSIMIDNERRMLTDRVRVLFKMYADIASRAVEGARLLIFKAQTTANVSTSIEEIRDAVVFRLNAYDVLAEEGNYREARRMIIEALNIVHRAHWRGVDIASIKDEFKEAIEDNLSLNDILGLDDGIDE